MIATRACFRSGPGAHVAGPYSGMGRLRRWAAYSGDRSESLTNVLLTWCFQTTGRIAPEALLCLVSAIRLSVWCRPGEIGSTCEIIAAGVDVLHVSGSVFAKVMTCSCFVVRRPSLELLGHNMHVLVAALYGIPDEDSVRSEHLVSVTDDEC